MVRTVASPGSPLIDARHQEGSDRDGGGGADQGRRHEVTGGIRHHGGQNSRVEHEHIARNGRHTCGHDHEQPGTTHVPQVGPDEQRRLGHPDEYIGGRRYADRTTDAEHLTQHPGKTAHNQRQHAPMEQQGAEYTDQQNQG